MREQRLPDPVRPAVIKTDEVVRATELSTRHRGQKLSNAHSATPRLEVGNSGVQRRNQTDTIAQLGDRQQPRGTGH
jgi:hypothetical protein